MKSSFRRIGNVIAVEGDQLSIPVANLPSGIIMYKQFYQTEELMAK